jgi:Ca2+-binding EF-hand superfamily protein
MFDTMKMGLPHDAIKDLFSQMDKDRNGEISYNEMLNYLREAKQEEDKLKKLKFIQERTKALRESSAFETNIADVGQNTMMTMESRL